MSRPYRAALSILIAPLLIWSAKTYAHAQIANESSFNVPSSLALTSGQNLEERIENEFKRRGFDIIPGRDWDQQEEKDNPNLRKLILNAPYKSIYEHAARIEFLILLPNRRILIEAKRQKTPGSTDEKLPYVFENAKLNLGFGQEFILIMEGNGWKDGARNWITSKARTTNGFYVFTPDEFFIWLDKL